jgi:hypothetical protein
MIAIDAKPIGSIKIKWKIGLSWRRNYENNSWNCGQKSRKL